MPDKRCCPVTSGAIAERVVVVYHVLPSVVRNEQKESMMTKADLVAQIAARANMTKAAAERSLNAMLESVQEMLAEDGKLTLTVSAHSLRKRVRNVRDATPVPEMSSPSRPPRWCGSVPERCSRMR